MTTITKDRDYYRSLNTKELIEEARRGVRVDWQELAVVLMEKLYDKRWNDDQPSRCPRCDYEIS